MDALKTSQPRQVNTAAEKAMAIELVKARREAMEAKEAAKQAEAAAGEIAIKVERLWKCYVDDNHEGLQAVAMEIIATGKIYQKPEGSHKGPDTEKRPARQSWMPG